MKYYAMIDGERRGPYELQELHDAGVRPDTYVWCKDMDDWEKAEDVADICRFYRQRIFGLMHPQPAQPAVAEQQPEQLQEGEQGFVPFAGFGAGQERFDPASPIGDENGQPPISLITVSVILTLLCFPLTGFVAIYYSVMTRRAWEEANRSEKKESKQLYTEEERRNYREMAYGYSRSAKMWCGITFFLGMILYAFLANIFG